MSPNLWERCQLNDSETDRCRGVQLYRKKPSLWFPMCAIVWLLVVPVSGHAQSAEKCGDGSMGQLKWAISMHNHNSHRLDKKFKDIYYFEGKIRPGVIEDISIEQIIAHLGKLGERKSAVLFHQVEYGRLSTWLITSSGKTVCAKPRVLSPTDWQLVDTMSWSTLGRQGAKRARQGTPLHHPNQSTEDHHQRWEKLLQKLSELLLPPEILSELTSSKTDTLVVVPITIRIGHDAQQDKTSSPRTFSLSTVPYATLPVGTDPLITKLSVVIAPGFLSFREEPVPAGRTYRNPIVLGNPVRSHYQDLPGAEEEAKQVAQRLETQAFVGESAKKAILDDYLQKHATSVDLIHLATHGIADADNPLDKSFLVFNDGVWNARQIGDLRLTSAPLVVMSACQTALGKNYAAGTIGLARAWQRAGASNVVMSLWSVDDEATKELMEHFVGLVASGQAVDKALQAAMLALREKDPDPSHWASFSIYGAPERLAVTANHPE